MDTCPQYDVDAALGAWQAAAVQVEQPQASSAEVRHPPKRMAAMQGSSSLVVLIEEDDKNEPQGCAEEAAEACSRSSEVQPNALVETCNAQNAVLPTSQPPEGLQEASQEPQCPAVLQEVAAEDGCAGKDLIEQAVGLP